MNGMNTAGTLRCYFCGRDYPFDPYLVLCPDCREPLGFLPAKPRRSIRTEERHPLTRHLDFLPLDHIDPSLGLGEGGTPLLPLARLGGLPNGVLLFAKNETVNPTGSFKDRGTSVVVQKARALGISRVGTVSTGNMAASTAAYAARAGLRALILVKGDTSAEKVRAATVFGPRLIRVEGEYGAIFDRSLDIARRHAIYFANSVDPVRVEGYKVTAFEIFEQMGGRVPDYLIVPLSSGGHVMGLTRGFLDLKAEGLAERMPVVVGVQASGCAPLARAFAAGLERYAPFPGPKTIAHAISNPTPPGGNVVLKLMRENAGLILDVSDEEMLAAQRALAESEGLFVLPDSATTLAGLARLAKRVRLAPGQTVVLVLTGTGLKNLEALESARVEAVSADLAGLDEAVSRLGV